MSARTFVSRTAAFIALVALGAACETKTVVTPPPPSPVGVTVSPLSATLTTVGQTVQFVALVTGGDNTTARTVTWSSSNTAVATVDANGVAKAVANGTASIIATSTADATAHAAGLVTVAIPTVPPVVVVPPTASIASITDLFGDPVNLAAISGKIIVTANVDQGSGNTINSINFNVDAKTITPCTQTLTQGKSVGGVTAQAVSTLTFQCQIPTDSLNAGVPVFPNGPHTITVSVVGPTGQLASASQAVTFANVSALNVAVASAKQALDNAGLQWNGGNLTVTVTPAVFNGQTLTSVMVSVASTVLGVPTTVSKTITTTGNAAFTVTFRADSTPANNGLSGFENAGTQVFTSAAVTTAGQSFNGNNGLSALRYDDAAPVFVNNIPAGSPASAFQNNFFNATATFANGGACTPAGANVTATCQQTVTATDGGVDKMTSTFQTTTFPLASTVVWTTQASATTMGNAPAGSLVSRVQVCDALANCANSGNSAPFGVDILPPQFVSVSTPGNINAAMPTVTVIAQDTGAAASGFATGWLFATITKDSASTTGADVQKCVDPSISGTGTLTSVPTGGCVAATTNSTVPAAFNYVLPTPTSPSGYYTETFFAVDLAGNKSATTQRLFLLDNLAPTVNVTGINTTVSPPQIAGTAHDNVDLKSINFREQFLALTGTFPGITSLPFQAATSIKAFGLPLQGNATIPASGAALVLSVQSGLAGTVYPLTGLGADARDQANLYGEGFISFAPGTGVGVTPTSIVSLTTAASNASICQQSTCTGSPTSTTLSAVALFTAGTTTPNPIVTVYFFAVDNTGHAVLIGSNNSPTLTIPTTTNERTFTYTLPATAASTFTILGPNTVFAVGVDANGNGVVMGPAVTVTTL